MTKIIKFVVLTKKMKKFNVEKKFFFFGKNRAKQIVQPQGAFPQSFAPKEQTNVGYFSGIKSDT